MSFVEFKNVLRKTGIVANGQSIVLIDPPLKNFTPSFALVQIKIKLFQKDWLIAETLLSSAPDLTKPIDANKNSLWHAIFEEANRFTYEELKTANRLLNEALFKQRAVFNKESAPPNRFKKTVDECRDHAFKEAKKNQAYGDAKKTVEEGEDFPRLPKVDHQEEMGFSQQEEQYNYYTGQTQSASNETIGGWVDTNTEGWDDSIEQDTWDNDGLDMVPLLEHDEKNKALKELAPAKENKFLGFFLNSKIMRKNQLKAKEKALSSPSKSSRNQFY